jgi:capsular exopolysaccharide synthesis family protein
LVTNAETPNTPFFPKTLPFLAGGLTLAFLFGIGAALARDRMDAGMFANLRRAAEPIPSAAVLAELPQLSSDAHGRLPSLRLALLRAQLDMPLQAALNRLYSGLALAGSRPRTILVTSSGPGEGKSFTTLALAQYAASTGRRVLVVDCDLRQPTFEAALGLRPPFGLSDALRGTVSPREATMTTELAMLDQISAGPPATDATELLARPQLQQLMLWAQKYDLVLLDGPSNPTDAAILAKHVDGVLCCARSGRSSQADAAQAVARMQEAGGNVLGVAVTMTKPPGQVRSFTGHLKAS